MKKVLLGIVSAVAIVAAVSGTALASTVSNNQGNVVLINSCADLGTVANNNKGNIVAIARNGQCDVAEIVKSPAIQNNSGNVVRIGNACGNTNAGDITNNKGNVVIIDKTPCQPNRPTTVVVTPATPVTPTAAPVATPVATPAQPTAAQIPVTGASSVVGIALGTSLLAYAGSYALSRKNQ